MDLSKQTLLNTLTLFKSEHGDRPALSSALLGEARSLSSAILSRLYVTHFSRVLPLGHARTRARMCIAPDVLGCPDFAGILLHVSRRSQADTSDFRQNRVLGQVNEFIYLSMPGFTSHA